MVDGASVARQYFQVIMPLCRPALRRAGDARVHVALQRLLLGRRAAAAREANGRSPRRSPSRRPVLQRLQPHCRGVDDDRAADARGVPCAAEALHQRADARRQQGVVVHDPSRAAPTPTWCSTRRRAYPSIVHWGAPLGDAPDLDALGRRPSNGRSPTACSMSSRRCRSCPSTAVASWEVPGWSAIDAVVSRGRRGSSRRRCRRSRRRRSS